MNDDCSGASVTASPGRNTEARELIIITSDKIEMYHMRVPKEAIVWCNASDKVAVIEYVSHAMTYVIKLG